jgi:hypothetical protein
VKMLCLLGALLLAAVHPARAQVSAACQTYTRASGSMPDMVRDWLTRSGDDHVRVCGRGAPGVAGGGEADAAPLYSGESVVRKQGVVCSYATHGLAPVGTGAHRQLRRYERGDPHAMVLAGLECPPPHAESYTVTYDVSAAAFVSIMDLWSSVAASTAAWDRALCCGGATGQRLRAAIGAGRMKSAAVPRIVQMSPGLKLHRRYALFVADPDSSPPGSRLYVLYVSHALGGGWRISGLADAVN